MSVQRTKQTPPKRLLKSLTRVKRAYQAGENTWTTTIKWCDLNILWSPSLYQAFVFRGNIPILVTPRQTLSASLIVWQHSIAVYQKHVICQWQGHHSCSSTYSSFPFPTRQRQSVAPVEYRALSTDLRHTWKSLLSSTGATEKLQI